MGKDCFSICNNDIKRFGFAKEIVVGLTENKHEGSINPENDFLFKEKGFCKLTATFQPKLKA